MDEQRKVTLESLKQDAMAKLDIQNVGSDEASKTLTQLERLDKLQQYESEQEDRKCLNEIEEKKLKMDARRIRVEGLKAGLGFAGKILGACIIGATTIAVGLTSDNRFYDKTSMSVLKFISEVLRGRD